MSRVNVFLKDKLLDEIDEAAKKQGTDRSAIIEAAVEEYLQAKRRNRQEEEKRKKMLKAAGKIDALAKNLGKWDPQLTIRKHRDTNLKSDS